MKKKLILGVVIFVGVCVLIAERVQRPQRIRKQFIGHLYQQEYDLAAQMLSDPSATEAADDGRVTLIDHNENRINVPPEKLPFMASGGMQTQPGEFSMTALGPNNNGILETPALTLYLRLNGNKVRIERWNF